MKVPVRRGRRGNWPAFVRGAPYCVNFCTAPLQAMASTAEKVEVVILDWADVQGPTTPEMMEKIKKVR